MRECVHQAAAATAASIKAGVAGRRWRTHRAEHLQYSPHIPNCTPARPHAVQSPSNAFDAAPVEQSHQADNTSTKKKNVQLFCIVIDQIHVESSLQIQSTLTCGPSPSRIGTVAYIPQPCSPPPRSQAQFLRGAPAHQINKQTKEET